MKKLMSIFTICILAAVVIASCSPAEQSGGAVTGVEEVSNDKAEYIRISAEEAKEIIDTEEVVILDVRTVQEYQEGHIEGAILIPDYDLERLAAEYLPDKEAKILVYCRTGRRSENASRLLIEMGYKDVYDFGGIVDWDYDIIEDQQS